jgi:serine/threonine protein kinase
MSQYEGQILGQYTIGALLSSGEGATGQVYQAVRRSDGEQFAIKILHGYLAADLKSRHRFGDEVKALQQIDHPHVIRIVDADMGDPLYLVLELMDESLQTLLDRRATEGWPLMLGIELVRQAADGLAAVHARGIIHRDVKPGNLLLRRIDAPGEPERFELKVADFGFSRSTKGSLSSRRAIGTPRYISLEQLNDRGKADARSDIYSLGVVLYEIATGAPPLPIQGDLESAALHHLISSIPLPRKLNPAISLELEALIMSCLARNPENRPDSAQALASNLSAIIEAERAQIGEQLAPVSTDPQYLEDCPWIGIQPERTTLTLAPGDHVDLPVTIRNISGRVDTFTLSVTSTPESPEKWVSLPEEPVSINDKRTATVTLGIDVPQGPAGRAGEYEVIVCAQSGNDTEARSTAPSRWNVREVAGGALTVESRRAKGRRQAAYALQVYNGGNIAAEYTLHSSDDGRDLRYDFSLGGVSRPVQVAPGETAQVDLTVQAPWHWLGRTRSHTFAIALAGGASPALERAEFLQRALIPRWLATMAVLIVALFAFIAFSPPLFWDATIRSLDGSAIEDDDTVVVRWRSFNTGQLQVAERRDAGSSVTEVSRQVAPLHMLIPSSETTLLRWLGLEPWEYVIPQGFPQTTTLTISATNLIGLINDESQLVPVVIRPRPAEAGLAVEPPEVIYGEPLTFTVTLKPTTESAELQDSENRVLATITRLPALKSLTQTLTLRLDTATGLMTSLAADLAVKLDIYNAENRPYSGQRHTYRLVPNNPGADDPPPVDATVTIVPRVREFTVSLRASANDPATVPVAPTLEISSVAPKETIRLAWAVDGAAAVAVAGSEGLKPRGDLDIEIENLNEPREVSYPLAFDGRELGKVNVRIVPLICGVAFNGDHPQYLYKSYHDTLDTPIDGAFDLRPSANDNRLVLVIPRIVNIESHTWVKVELLNTPEQDGWLPLDTLACPDEQQLRGVQEERVPVPTATPAPTPTNTPIPPTAMPTSVPPTQPPVPTQALPPTPNIKATADAIVAAAATQAAATQTAVAAASATADAIHGSGLDLIRAAPEARWSNGAGQLKYGRNDYPATGYAYIEHQSVLENNKAYSNMLHTHPERGDRPGLYIRGDFDVQLVLRGQYFLADIGFGKPSAGPGSPNGVTVKVLFKGNTIYEDIKRYDGKLKTIKVDMSSYDGQSGVLTIIVDANGDSGRDWLNWLNPRIAFP